MDILSVAKETRKKRKKVRLRGLGFVEREREGGGEEQLGKQTKRRKFGEGFAATKRGFSGEK